MKKIKNYFIFLGMLLLIPAYIFASTYKAADYFPKNLGLQIEYKVTDSTYNTTQYFKGIIEPSNKFLFAILFFDSNNKQAGSWISFTKKYFNNKEILFSQTGAPVMNIPFVIYQLFAIPTFFEDEESYSTYSSNILYSINKLDEYNIDDLTFTDCVKVNITLNEDYDTNFKKGSGYYILAKDIGIVKIHYETNNGKIINFDYISQKQTGLFKIGGNISCDSCGNISDYVIQISNADGWHKASIDSNGNFQFIVYGDNETVFRIGKDLDNNGSFDDMSQITYYYVSCSNNTAYKSYGVNDFNITISNCYQYIENGNDNNTITIQNLQFKPLMGFFNVKYSEDYPYAYSNNLYALVAMYYIYGENVNPDNYKIFVEYDSNDGYGVVKKELGFYTKRVENSEGFYRVDNLYPDYACLLYSKTIDYNFDFNNMLQYNGKNFKFYLLNNNGIKIANSEYNVTIPENGIKVLSIPEITTLKGIVPYFSWNNVDNSVEYKVKLEDILIDDYYKKVYRKPKIYFTELSDNQFDLRNVKEMNIKSGKYSLEIYAFDKHLSPLPDNSTTFFLNISKFYKLIDIKFPIPSNEIFQSGWHLLGATTDYTLDDLKDSFTNPALKTVWKWKNSGWQIWSPNINILNLINNYGITLIDNIKEGEGFWINE